MSLNDSRGVRTSATNQRSLDLFEKALHRLNAYDGDPVEAIDAALAEEPGFVTGHLFRAHVHISMWERSVVADVTASLEAATALTSIANERERAHMAAIRAWLDGDWRGYQGRLDRILVNHPRDLMALQLGHLSDFYLGDRDNLRGRVLRALPEWSAETPGWGYVLGMAAFGLEECADYGSAEETGRRALEIDPADGWAQHAVAHVMEMQSRQAEAIAFMEERARHWGKPTNAFAFHNWWHTALYNLDLDRVVRAVELYDGAIRNRGSAVQLEMVDAAALLWRLHLRGVDVDARWEEVADCYAAQTEAGFYAFNDMHAMMAFVATRRTKEVGAVMQAATRAAQQAGTNAWMLREVGMPILRAIAAFGEGRYAEVVDLLLPVRYRAHAFGGSHAQRDVIHRTLIEAAIRGGDRRLAGALTAERTRLKPHCPFSWALAARAGGTAGGRTEGAREAA